MTGPYRGRQHEHDQTQPAPGDVFRRLGASMNTRMGLSLVAISSPVVAQLLAELAAADIERSKAAVLHQPPPAVDRAEQLAALDVITTKLRDDTEALDQRFTAFTNEIFYGRKRRPEQPA